MSYIYSINLPVTMQLSAITAAGRNNVIGKDNRLPWHMPADMRYFKTTTLGHVVIMGRKTYDSFGKALPGRTNIVITRQPDFQREDAQVFHSLEEAIRKARDLEETEVFILGGAQIYHASLPLLDRIYLTRIYGDFDGDAFFPEIDPRDWKLVGETPHEADEKNHYPYSFQVWERKE